MRSGRPPLLSLAFPMLLLATFALTGACAGSQGPPTLTSVVDAAAAQRRPLVIEFYATWCGPCKHFERDILPDPRVQAALAGMLFVRYDVDTPEGQDAFQRCHASAMPTFVGVDAAGRVRLFKEGTERSADDFLAFLAQAKQVLAPATP
jgi:thiol:disulfide interchange protein